jgi:hypothetical protein
VADANAKAGIDNPQQQNVSFEEGEIQVLVEGQWTYHDNRATCSTSGGGEFDCPDGGDTEEFDAIFEYYRRSDCIIDGTHTVKMMCVLKVGTTSYPVPSDERSVTINCP